MNHAKLLLVVIATFTLFIAACAPRPDRDERGPRLSAQEIFTRADSNGDSMLSFDEFENSLPQ